MAGGSRSEFGSSRGDDTVKRLGRYQIIGRLATGGMAEVYLALSGEVPGFRTLVVVKRILPHLASNAQFIRMFLDEARLAALLDHPNIVRIIEVGHDGEDYFLVMELVQGKPLSAVLRKAAREHRPPSAALTAYMISHAANGLGYAHTLTDGENRPLGVVHRDVSPQNVLISFEGAVKLIDFGVARAFGRVAHTSPGGLKGKIDYMSPEQASAEEVDHRADVFALGVVLWEALTGRRLFRRETELATMRAIVDDPIPKPSEIVEIAPELDAIVMRALRKRKDARFATAHEMAAALEKFALSQPGFSPMQIASYTKSLFAAEYLQWRKTATAALDLEVEKPAVGAETAAALGAEPPTAGPTMALRPGVSWADGRSELRSASGRSRSSQSQGQGKPRSHVPSGQSLVAEGQTQAPATSATGASVVTTPDRTWLYAVVGVLLAAIGGGAWMMTRQQDMPALETQTVTPAPVVAAPAPAVTPVPPAAAATPVTQREAPAGPSEMAGSPAPAPAAAETAKPPADSASWSSVARSSKPKPISAHRHTRTRAAPTSAPEDAKEKAAALDTQKADPFAD
jgi:serine/threonine-protein kinase